MSNSRLPINVFSIRPIQLAKHRIHLKCPDLFQEYRQMLLMLIYLWCRKKTWKDLLITMPSLVSVYSVIYWVVMRRSLPLFIGRSKSSTEFCQREGYYCDATGRVWTRMYYKPCTDTCYCVNLYPACLPGVFMQCGKADVSNTTNLQLPANVTDSADQSPTNMTTTEDAPLNNTTSSSLEDRDLEKRHNWALVCGTRGVSATCSQLGYACALNGRIIKPTDGLQISQCNRDCSCKNIGSLSPDVCLISPKLANCFGAASEREANNATAEQAASTLGKDVVDDDMTDNVSITDNTPTSTTSQSSLPSTASTSAPTLVKRHNWALVCANRDKTAACSKLGYGCTDTGGPIWPPRAKITHDCEVHCQCINIGNMAPNICLNNPKLATCFEAASDQEASNVMMEHDAIDSDNVTNEMQPLTTSPSPVPSTSSPTPPSLAKRHNWALVCLNRELTSGCQEIGYSCNALGHVSSSMGRTTRCNDECRCINVGGLRADICAIAPVIADCFGLKDTDGVGSGDPGPILTS